MPNLKARLLIVDDEPSTRTLLSQIFGDLDHPVPTETRTNNPKEIQSTEKLGLDFQRGEDD
jgi:CheY-like chemotaxis protein